MRVYDVWDYVAVAVDVFHLMCLLSLLGIMGILFLNELKKFQ
jgi:hypothetical protein